MLEARVFPFQDRWLENSDAARQQVGRPAVSIWRETPAFKATFRALKSAQTEEVRATPHCKSFHSAAP